MSQDPVRISPPVARGVTHAGPIEDVQMNKWHFILVLDRMRAEHGRAHWDWCLIPFGFFLGMGQALVTSDFKAAFGIDGNVWHAAALNFTGLSAVATLGLFVWWVVDSWRHPAKTAEQVWNEVIDEMAKDREKAAAYHRAAGQL